MDKIFINYRRDDSQHQADRLWGLLKKWLKHPQRDVFIDVDNIPGGVDFVKHLDDAVKKSGALLVLIGKQWLTATDSNSGQKRLDDPNDFVRLEIEHALARDIPVVPVLLDGASMPTADELPASLQALSRRNGFTVSRLSFESDVKRLIHSLPIKLATRSVFSMRNITAAILVAGGLGFGAFTYLGSQTPAATVNTSSDAEYRAVVAARAAAMDGCVLFGYDSGTPIEVDSTEIATVLGMNFVPDIPDLQEVVIAGFDDPDSSRSRSYAVGFSERRATTAGTWLQENLARNITIVPYGCGKVALPEYYSEWICGARIIQQPADGSMCE